MFAYIVLSFYNSVNSFDLKHKMEPLMLVAATVIGFMFFDRNQVIKAFIESKKFKLT